MKILSKPVFRVTRNDECYLIGEVDWAEFQPGQYRYSITVQHTRKRIDNGKPEPLGYANFPAIGSQNPKTTASFIAALSLANQIATDLPKFVSLVAEVPTEIAGQRWQGHDEFERPEPFSGHLLLRMVNTKHWRTMRSDWRAILKRMHQTPIGQTIQVPYVDFNTREDETLKFTRVA
jgi:hypothetical protein